MPAAGLRYDPRVRALRKLRHPKYRMPEGVRRWQLDRAAWVVGASYFRILTSCSDHTRSSAIERVVGSVDSLNVGLGWWF